MPADNVVLEALVREALGGSLRHCRELYRRLDDEAQRPRATRVKRRSNDKLKKAREAFEGILRNYAQIQQQMLDLGLISRSGWGRVEISQRAAEALADHQYGINQTSTTTR